MKLHLTLLLLGGMTLAAVVTAAAIHHHDQVRATPAVANQLFDVKGEVRGLESDGFTIRIAHEEIPGFMPAMEMPFTVKDCTLLKGLKPGDRVAFQLEVTKDDSWLTRIEKSGELPAVPSIESTAASSAPEGEGPRRVQTGEAVPDFSLADQHGRPFRLSDFRGKAVVLTFIYTRCPLPNFCPLMSKNFASLQQRFAKQVPGKVQLLSISFDPQFDTPQVLARYAALFQAEERDWTFATGTPAQVNFVSGLFGLIREPSNGFINHDLRTALIDPDGKLVHVWRSNVWTPYEVQRMVQETISAHSS